MNCTQQLSSSSLNILFSDIFFIKAELSKWDRIRRMSNIPTSLSLRHFSILYWNTSTFGLTFDFRGSLILGHSGQSDPMKGSTVLYFSNMSAFCHSSVTSVSLFLLIEPWDFRFVMSFVLVLFIVSTCLSCVSSVPCALLSIFPYVLCATGVLYCLFSNLYWITCLNCPY